MVQKGYKIYEGYHPFSDHDSYYCKRCLLAKSNPFNSL